VTTNLTDHDSRIPDGLRQPPEQDYLGAIEGFLRSGSGMWLVPQTDTAGADCAGVGA
jgi:hypothetical protein